MELLKNLEGLSADEQMTAVVELQKAAMKHLEEQKQASIGKSAELVIQGLKKIKSDFEAKFDSLNYDIQTKVASLKDGEQGLQGPKGDQGDRGLDGANGRDGRDGKDGKDGIDGVDGVGVRDAKIDFDGSLVISLTDGREINCGEVVSVDVAKQIQKVTHNIQTGSGGDSQTVLDAIAAIQATIATYGTMATQNANNVAITGGAINNTTIGATTPNTGVFTTLVGNSTSEFGKGSANYFRFTGNTTGNGPTLRFTGSDSNIDGIYAVRGTGAHRFFTNDNNQQQFQIAHTASAVNYVQVTGSATGSAPTVSSQGSDSGINLNYSSKGTYSSHIFTGAQGNQFQITGPADGSNSANRFIAYGGKTGTGLVLGSVGSDTNISSVFQTKGTGAIDLAAGSSGVNISNGGTVTAITRTASGGSYTSMPSMAISAPTTAGGVQATATPYMGVQAGPTLGSGGTGYTANDVLTISGYVGTPSTIRVDTVSAGVITGFTLTAGGAMSTIPSATSPVSFTGGTGSGATFNILYQMSSSGALITNAGSGYVEQPTVTFSGGGGSGAAAYATVGSTTTFRSIGHSGTVAMRFDVPSSLTSNVPALRLIDAASTQDSGMQVCPATGGAIFNAFGATNAYAGLFANGTGQVKIGSGGTGQTLQLNVSHTASAVNYVQVTGAATGGVPTVIAQGSDSSVGLGFATKSANYLYFLQSGANPSFRITTGATSNYLDVKGGATGSDPVLSAQGSDTNIDLVLSPKGTGALQAQQTDSTATGGNARGANAVDWQTARGSASNVASGTNTVVGGGYGNTASGGYGIVAGGLNNSASGIASAITGGSAINSSGIYSASVGGNSNTNSAYYGSLVGGQSNTAAGHYNFIGGGFTNSGTSGSAVTTQSATMNGTTAVTLSGSNASIKVGQLITGTSIATFTYVAAISGTSLTLSQAASGSSTSTLSFYTPHGVVVGGGNNQATGAYSFIGGGGDAGTAAGRNTASGAWASVVGGTRNTASGIGSFVGGGGTDGIGNYYGNIASGTLSVIAGGWNNQASNSWGVVSGGQSNVASGPYSAVTGGSENVSNSSYGVVNGGQYGTTRSITGLNVSPASTSPISGTLGVSQTAFLVLARQTTDATATVLTSNTSAAGTTNQVILPNNSAYYFRGEIVSGVTGGGNTKGWTIEGVIKRGANAASTTLVGSTVTSMYADAGAVTWTIALSADTTNGGLAVTFTGQAATTIRTVAQIRTTEMTY